MNPLPRRESPGARPSRAWRWLYPLFSLLCLAWLLVRSGRKPSRLRYPCQQAAAVHSVWALGALGAGLLCALRSRGRRRLWLIPLLTALVAYLALGVGGGSPVEAVGKGVPELEQARMRAASLTPRVWQGADADGDHDVFVVTNVPVPQPGNPHHQGVDAMIRFLGEGGVPFYDSEADYPGAGPRGLIRPDDVVLLKVNAAWDQRGMTNTDVVRGLITAVLEHPDGFTGEVVLVENCEGGPDYNQAYNNAEDIHQTFQAVVDSYGDPGRVSASSWWSFTDNLVYEYDSGDYRQGYVLLGDNVSYPKFSTGRGTHVSLRRGVWTGSGYDKDRLKLINVPVLKSHNATGVTACVKNYMGVPSIHMTRNVHYDLIYQGFTGRVMNETIYPCLNVLDAVWVSPSHPQGPAGPYSLAVRTDILLAGTDPVALDYYAGKHVLYPVSGYGRHDPDTPYNEGTNPYHDGTTNTGYAYNAFRIMLESNAAALQSGGHDVTLDPSRMTVHLRDLSEWLTRSGGHCVLGAQAPAREWYFAEGTTREGFDEWLCLQNPGEEAAAAHLTMMTGEGDALPYDLELPPHSRTTLHVNHVLGPGRDVSISVEAGRPIIAERPMYFLYNGAWSGGHCVLGAQAPAQQWYFAEGTCRPSFDPYICIQNPAAEAAEVEITYMKGDGTTSPQSLSVGGRSRFTVRVKDVLGQGDDVGHDFSARVRSVNGVPVIAERPMYFLYNGAWSGGHCVLGAQAPAGEWYFAEGTCREGFDEWLCLQNPGEEAATAELTLMTGEGEAVPYGVDLAPHSRTTLHVNHILGPGKDVSISVKASRPIIAERPMYFQH